MELYVKSSREFQVGENGTFWVHEHLEAPPRECMWRDRKGGRESKVRIRGGREQFGYNGQRVCVFLTAIPTGMGRSAPVHQTPTCYRLKRQGIENNLKQTMERWDQKLNLKMEGVECGFCNGDRGVGDWEGGVGVLDMPASGYPAPMRRVPHPRLQQRGRVS